MTGPTDFIGELHTQLAQYAAMVDRHAERLAPYEGKDGEPEESLFDRYADQRSKNTTEAEAFLADLALRLHELAGPPVPGTPFTLTFAGPERHDGEQPYSFVVNGSDLNDAGSTLLHLPFFREWFTEQAGWDDGTPPDVLYIADESHPGLPEWGAYNDLRREQAAFLAAAEQPAPAPGSAPTLPPTPPLALLG
ncbi:hypothetical protein AB0J01_28260 [Streptomyces sp. NPDC050204]|uniref:hypothetical protein n=1 Tax=Streptomyces sp. NPDC050204 TaxID=3155514 RepID=UPI003429468C